MKCPYQLNHEFFLSNTFRSLNSAIHLTLSIISVFSIVKLWENSILVDIVVVVVLYGDSGAAGGVIVPCVGVSF